jgi:hypothetical protein
LELGALVRAVFHLKQRGTIILQPQNSFDERACRSPRHERNEKNSSTAAFHGAAFVRVDCLQGVIAAFDINVRLSQSEKPRGADVGKDAYPIDNLQ